jgi:hypothetical protein
VIAGLLATTVAPGWQFLADAVSFGAVIAALLMMNPTELHRTPAPQQVGGQARVGPVRQTAAMLVEGLRYVRSQPVLLGMLVLVGVVVTFGKGWALNLPLLTSAGFGAGPVAAGVLMAAVGVGAVIGAVLAARRHTDPPDPDERAGAHGRVVSGTAE